MAYTATKIRDNVMGCQRTVQYKVTADAASGVVVTDLGKIECLGFAAVSMSTFSIVLKINTNAASAAANGSVMVSSVASGDVFFLTCYGR